MKYTISQNGSFCLESDISVKNAYPWIDGEPIHPIGVTINENSICYELEQGRVTLNFAKNDHEISVETVLDDMPRIHDFQWFGGGRIQNADHIFCQGLGMEGPSGYMTLEDETRRSYGLTSLCNGSVTLLFFTTDHQAYTTCFTTAQSDGGFDSVLRMGAGLNLEGTFQGNASLPTLYIREGQELADELRLAARRIAERMNARKVTTPAFHWCSWYYLYQNVSQGKIDEYLEQMPDCGFRYIQIDAGYCPSIGDWLIPNHRFPEGLSGAARSIQKAGFQPGIWVAPFIVGDRSELYREHPDWVLRNLDDTPVTMIKSYTEPKIWGNEDSNYFVLDTSNPEALSYIRTVFTTLRSWGFTLFKTDFMLWNMHDTAKVKRYDSSLTSVQIMRNTLAVIRECIGEGSYLLGCIAPFMPFIGYADGMRIASDVGAQWKDVFGPVNMIREISADNYFNNIFWQNDPDSVLLRDFDTELSAEETRSLALLQALSGGVITTSDPVHRLQKDRQELLSFIRPKGLVDPIFPELAGEKEDVVILHHLPQGTICYALNPTEHPITEVVRFKDIFQGKEGFVYAYSFSEDEVISQREEIHVQTLPAHGFMLLFLTEEPLSTKPANLWKW